MKVEKVVFSSGGRRLVGFLHTPREGAPCVIACHGFYSSKDGRKYIEVASKFCENGIAVLRFDFSGCGESDGRFEETTLKGRIEDLNSALKFVRCRMDSVGLLGRSLGGSLAILKAAENRWIRAVVAWSTPANLEEIFRGMKKIGNEWFEYHGLKVKTEFLDDLQAYDVIEATRKVQHLMIIHGSLDEQVSSKHAEDLYENAAEPKMLKIIEGANHRFTDDNHRREAVELSLNWFKRHLQDPTEHT